MKKTRKTNNIRNMANSIKNLPPQVLLQGIESSLVILEQKGIKVRDWDNKDRVLQQTRWIGGKAYFFAGKQENESD